MKSYWYLVIVFVVALPFINQIGFSAEIDPDLLLSINKMQANDTIHVIIIANGKLTENQYELLRNLGITIERNFTLAPWYEVSLTVKDISTLQNLDFVTQIKPVEEYKPLGNETSTKGNNGMNLLIFTVLLLVIFAIVTFALKRKYYKMFALALLAIALFSQIPVSYAEVKGIHPEFNLILTGFQEAKSIELPEKIYSQITQNQIKVKEEKVDPRILASGDDRIKVLIEATDKYENTDLKYLQKTQMQEFQLGNFFYMEISKSEIIKLEKSDFIKKVWLETQYKPLLDASVPLIKANTFWNNGYNGSGIRVCVLDTGINKTHPALSSRVIAEKDFTGLDDPRDVGNGVYTGHGTHVAGIVASTDSTYRGVAPGASILNAKVCINGGCSDSNIMSAIDWCISNNVSVITISIGGPQTPADGSDLLSRYVDSAVDQGKVLTISAGNSGPSSNTISCPGCAHKVITVGSTQSGKSFTTQDLISSFSSRGPTDDSRIKPDVTAFGEPITSAKYSDGGWTSLSGTSMAAPMVGGLSALILQAKNMSPEEVKTLLMNTAVDLGVAGKDNIYGAGRVNASKVFNEINFTRKENINNSYRVHNIYVPSSSPELRVTLYWPENYTHHNDLDLYLLDPSGNIKSYSISSSNTDEIVKVSNPTPSGNWKILVDPYSLVTTTQNYSIATNYMSTQQFYWASNITSSIVFHQINVSSSSLEVSLDWNSSLVDLDIYLYNTTGHLVNYSLNISTNTEKVRYNNPESGIWLLRINPFSLGGFTNVTYSVTSTDPLSMQIIDTIKPSINLTAPVNNSNYSSAIVNFSFFVTDNMNTFVSCYSSLDNNLTLLGNFIINNSYNSSFNTSDGSHAFNLTCVDGSLNTASSQNTTISIDSTKPNFTFISPSDSNNSFVSRNYTFISVNIVDLNTIDSCTLEWNGTNQTMTKLGSGNNVTCIYNKTDSDGTYFYKVYANDSLGNNGFISRVITFDATRPIITNFFPLPNSFVKGSDNETFNMTYTETNVGSSNSVYFFWKNSTETLYNSTDLSHCPSGINVTCTYVFNMSGLSDDYRIKWFFDIFDKSGNDAIFILPVGHFDGVFYNLTIDRLKPNISVTNPLNNQLLNTTNVTLNFTASDNSFISNCSYKLNNNTPLNLIKNITFIANEGGNNISISCSDTASNVASSSINFTVDTTPPSLISLKNTPNSPASFELNKNYTFTATFFDNTSISRVDFILDGINYSNVTQISTTYDNFSTGNLNTTKWNVSCGDTLGCVPFVGINTTTNTFEILQATPHGIQAATATYLNLIAHNFSDGERLEFDFNYSGTGNQVAGFTYDSLSPAPAFFLVGYWNGVQQDGNASGLYHFNMVFLTNKTVKAYVTKPDNSIVSKVFNYSTDNPIFYVSGATGHNGIFRGDYDNFIINAPSSVTITNLSIGTHNYTWIVNDSAGNMANYSFNYSVIDDKAPAIEFTSPTPINGSVLTSASEIFVNVSLSDFSPISSCMLEWNSSNESMNVSNFTCYKNKTHVFDGNYTYRIYSNDSFNNTNSTILRYVSFNATRAAANLINNLTQRMNSSNVSVTIISSNGNIVNTSQLITSQNFTIQFNLSSILIETANFSLSSLNLSSLLNITNNLTSATNISQAVNSSGGLLDNYVWVDLNNMLPEGNFTAKLVFPRVYGLYFYLNGSKDAPNITQVTNTCNANISNTPCYVISGNISSLYLPSFSGGAGGNDTQAPNISVSSPTSTTYSTTNISLSYTISDNAFVNTCWYKLNTGSNITIANCTNITFTAAQGTNTLYLYANDTSGNQNISNVNFTVTIPSSDGGSSGGGGGGGGGFIVLPKNQTNKSSQPNTTNQSITLIQTNQSSNQTQQQLNQEPYTNKTEEKSTETAKNVTGDTTPTLPITGFAAYSSSPILLGGIVAVIVAAVLILWKLKLKKK